MEVDSDCPTAQLVDLTVPKVATPRTPRRPCKTPKTPKSGKKQRVCAGKDVLMATENTETPRSRFIKRDGYRTDKDPCELPRKNTVSTPEISQNFCLLDEEKYDFDLSLSPSSSQTEDTGNISELSVRDAEEEIFFGPVGHKEKCIAKNVETEQVSQPENLSPLTATEMVLLFKEANTVAFHFKAKGTPMKTSKSSQSSQSSLDSPVVSEAFSSQGTKRKLNILDTEFDLPSPKIQVKDDKKVVKAVFQKPPTNVSKRQSLEVPKRSLVNPKGVDPKTQRLQRSSSMRLPKSKLNIPAPSYKASSSENTGSVSRLPCQNTRTRHLSISSNKDSSFSSVSSRGDSPRTDAKTQALNSSLCVPGQKRPPRLSGQGISTTRVGAITRPGALARSMPKTMPKTAPSQEAKVSTEKLKPEASSGLTRKPSLLRGAMTRPELMKPGCLQRKTGVKVPGASVPRGPMKATASITEVQTPAPLNRTKPTLKTGVGRTASPVTTATPRSTPGSVSSRGRLSMSTPDGQPLQPKRLNTSIQHHTSLSNRRSLSVCSNTSTPTYNKQTSGSTSSTPGSLMAKRRSYLPSPGKNTSIDSARSLRSSASSTDSILESPPAANVSLNQSRNSCNKSRRTMLTPTAQPGEKIQRSIPSPSRRSIASPSSRRSIVSPATRLASKLQPLHLDTRHKHVK